jgi:hypothetical protein
VLLFVGLFLGLYTWWKVGRDEHLDELALFDAYFLSFFVYLVFGRIGEIIMRHETLHTFYRMIALLAYPGIVHIIGIGAALIFIWLFARNAEWDPWMIWDMAAVALLAVVVFGALGSVANLANPGIETAWGLVHPGDTVRRFPVDIWSLIWSIPSFGIVSRVRKNFRFYTWYKGEASVAQDGLAALVGLASLGWYYFIRGWIDVGMRVYGVIPVMSLWGIILVFVSIWLTYQRSGSRREGNLLQWGGYVLGIRRVKKG